MGNFKADNQADFMPVEDRGEAISLLEPLVLSSDFARRSELMDIAIDLVAQSSSLRSSLPAGISTALSRLVRNMNCYYSNLIEGHNTHPIDIERAMNADYNSDPKRRNLHLEAVAHVNVQTWIDTGGVSEKAPTATSVILEIHRRFCQDLPDELLWLELPHEKRIKIEPGKLRKQDVIVGKHIAISAGALPRFLERFEEVYGNLPKSEQLLAVAAAHHRLLWIHPFLDGNGRVARLVSYASLSQILDTGGIWSVARGLARSEAEYKLHLMDCDQSRRGDFDGRGSLSESALGTFIRYFLMTCVDQVKFMRGLVQPEKLRERILAWAQRESQANNLLPNATAVFEALLYKGELQRAEVPAILNLGERQARRVVSGLIHRGVLKSASDRAPLHLEFPASLANDWMPGLFPSLSEN